jgi:hypothetical protein
MAWDKECSAFKAPLLRDQPIKTGSTGGKKVALMVSKFFLANAKCTSQGVLPPSRLEGSLHRTGS